MTINKNFSFFITIFLLLTFSTLIISVYADDRKKLITLLSNTHSIKCNFVETISNNIGTSDDDSSTNNMSGIILAERNGRFRFEAEDKFNEKHIIVSDGTHLFFYESSLKQLIKKNIEVDVYETPISILISPTSRISHRYVVKKLHNERNENSFSLNRRGKNSMYRDIIVSFNDKDTIKEICFTDESNQKVSMELSNVVTNIKMSDSDYIVNVPKGTEIIEE